MTEFNNYSDSELINLALQIGVEDFIVLATENDIANREEVIGAIVACLNRENWDETSN